MAFKAGQSGNPKGRKPGSRNKRTVEAVEAIVGKGLTPLEYLTSIYQDETKDEVKRMDAAKAAAPYVHSRLSNVEMSVSDADKPAEELPEDILNRIAATGSEGVIEAQGSAPQSEGIH